MKYLIVSGLVFVSVLTSALVLSGQQVSAATAENCVRQSNNFLAFPTWYKHLNPTFNEATQSCDITFNPETDIGKVLLAVVEIMLRVAAMVAVAFVIWGGFKYILSQGNSEAATSARKTIVNALIGLMLALFAIAIVNLIARSLTG